MFFFYWLLSIMAFDQHWLWGWQLFGTFTIIKIVGLICLVFALVRIAGGSASLRIAGCPQAGCYLVFLAFQCASYFVQFGELVNPENAYFHVFSIFSLFLVVLTLVDTRQRLYRSVLVGVGTVGFASLYTVRGYQKAGYGHRPGGMFADANEYALVAGLWMPVALLWIFSSRPRWERALCLGCLIAMTLGTTVAASRGGFLGLVAAFLFLIVNSPHRLRNLAVGAALILPLGLLVPSSALSRLTDPTGGDEYSKEARLVAWRAGMRMIQERPMSGIGIGNFKPFMEKYKDPNSNVVTLAHNTYMEITAELGVFSVVVFLGMLGAAIYSLQRVRRRAEAGGVTHLANVALGLQAGLISYAVSACFMTAWWQKLVWLPIFLTMCLHRLGAKVVVARNRRGSREHVPQPEWIETVGAMQQSTTVVVRTSPDSLRWGNGPGTDG